MIYYDKYVAQFILLSKEKKKLALSAVGALKEDQDDSGFIVTFPSQITNDSWVINLYGDKDDE